MFKHPAAPAPKATNKITIVAYKISVFAFEVRKPTAQVNTTSDITLGFINNINDLK